MSPSRPARRGSALWRYVRRLLVGAIILTLMLLLGPTAAVWGLSWNRTRATVADTPARDVTLVLGASVLPNGEPSAFLQARLDLAADLYDAGRTKVLLVSGDASQQYYNEPAAMKRYLVERRGIPADKVVPDFGGVDTYSSCVRAKKVFGVDTLTIVTQTYHLARAVAACELVGIDAQGLGDESVSRSSEWRRGQLREGMANIKLLWDVASGRQPTLGPKQDAVQRALSGG